MSELRPRGRFRGGAGSCRRARSPPAYARRATWWTARSDTGSPTGATARGGIVDAPGAARSPIRGSAVRRASGGAPDVCRRSPRTASRTKVEFGAHGSVCRIGPCNPLRGSQRPCGTLPAMRWGKWNMDIEGRRMGPGETGNPRWRDRRRADGVGWDDAGSGQSARSTQTWRACPGSRRGPPHRVSCHEGRWRCNTRVQAIDWNGKL